MAPRRSLLLGAVAVLRCATALQAAAGSARPARRLAPRAATAYTLDDKAISSPVTPMQNFILVKLSSSVSMTLGGMIMPDESQEKVTEGQVVSAGPGLLHPSTGFLLPNPVEAGESVLFGEYDGIALDYCGEQHTLVRDEDVLLAWRGEKTLDNVRTIGDRLLVRVTKKADETASGLALSAEAAASAKVSEGVVLKAGAGRLGSSGKTGPMPVKADQYVKYRDYAGNAVSIGAEDFVVCRASDCLSMWEGDTLASALPAP